MTTQSAHERIPAFTIADRLRKARGKTGLDQAEFAEEIGVARGTVSNYESDEYAGKRKRPYLMAWALRADVPLEWLESGKVSAGGDGEPNGSMDTCGYPYRQAA